MDDKVNKKLFAKQGFGIFGNKPDTTGILRSKFLIPPFSVLNAREGDWQTRKRAWLRLGIQSELGRAEDITWGVANLDEYRDLEELKKQQAKNVCPGRAPMPLDRKDYVSPGGSPRPAMDYSKRQRGRGDGKPLTGKTYHIGDWMDEKAGGARGGDAKKGKKTKVLAPGGTGANTCWRGASGKPLGAKYQGGLADGLVAHRAAQKEGSTTDYEGQEETGTSIFDPVLCELAYRWFCPPNGLVVDPFAGGSVRGIVASILGRRYTGIDLRQIQLNANKVQAERICEGFTMPNWIQGDSNNILDLVQDNADFIFSCPPYGDLERYSENPLDLSAMEWPDFLRTYKDIIFNSCELLKNNRFACFVVGDFRDKEGNYRNFVSETIKAFMRAGLTLYNEMVLITAVGSLPIRVTKQFEVSRKVGKTHQNMLVFLKGDARKATKRIIEGV